MVSKTSSSWKLQLLLTTKYGIKDIVKLEITTLTNNKIWYQRHRQAGNYNSYQQQNMVSKTSSSWKLQLLLTTKYGIKDIVKLEITTLTNNKIWYQRHRQAGNYNSY